MNDEKNTQDQNEQQPRRRKLAMVGNGLNWLTFILLVVSIGIALSHGTK